DVRRRVAAAASPVVPRVRDGCASVPVRRRGIDHDRDHIAAAKVRTGAEGQPAAFRRTQPGWAGDLSLSRTLPATATGACGLSRNPFRCEPGRRAGWAHTAGCLADGALG